MPAESLLLVGIAGASHWPYFRRWRAAQPAELADPLDRWTRAVLEPIATSVNARAVFPFEKPYLPFQQWAMRAEGLRSSPLGILMHPQYGLWHAYSAALLFEHELPIPTPGEQDHLCDACVGKPCLKACPVAAYSHAGFGLQACLGHVRSAARGTCRSTGCLDRNACPYGAAYRYPADMQAFHMAAFAA
jgi:hypothetical protein